MSPPATGKPEQVDGWIGWAQGQATAHSQLLFAVQAAARGILQGSQTLAVPPWGFWSLGRATPVLPACPSSGALPPTPRPDYHLPLGTEAPVQPREKASFTSTVQYSTPGPDLSDRPQSRLRLVVELTPSTSQLPCPACFRSSLGWMSPCQDAKAVCPSDPCPTPSQVPSVWF